MTGGVLQVGKINNMKRKTAKEILAESNCIRYALGPQQNRSRLNENIRAYTHPPQRPYI